MDHAAAHERIQDLLLEPSSLAALEESRAPDDTALREHLDACPACRAELDGWRALGRRIGDALPASRDEAAAAVEPIDVPPSLRTAALAAIRPRTPAPRGAVASARGARSRGGAWLALAASLVVLVGASAIAVDQAARRAAAAAEADELAEVVAAVDAVLATDHAVVALRRPDGSAAGSISWSRHDWVVLTTALTEPPDHQRYRCWLENGDRSVSVGVMEFTGGTAYWVETLDDWATWEIGPSTRFVVSLEAADAETRAGPIVLSADLES